jgi:hypothetical protein
MRSAPGSRPRGGFTMVEAVMAILLVLLLLVLVVRGIRLHSWTASGVDRLDVLQRMRITEAALRQLLSRGTSLLYPPIDLVSSPADHRHLVFTSATNGAQVVYLTAGGEVRTQDSEGRIRVLVEGVEELAVTQPLPGLARCRIALRSPDVGASTLVVSAHVGNHFHRSSGVTP